MKMILIFPKKLNSFLNLKSLFALIPGFLCLLTIYPAYSHVHSSHSHNKDNLSIAQEIIAQAFALAPEVIERTEHSQAQAYVKTHSSPFVPFITIGEKSIPVNSGFWNIVKGWIRLYRHELEHYCPCDINAEELVQQAKDHTAQGLLQLKVGKPLAHLVEHSTLVLYGYASQYGKVFAILKAALEVAEHSLSFFVGGKGLGVLCNIFDVMLFFFLRKAQTYTRIILNSNTINENSLSMIFRMAVLNRIMKTAERNVFFLLETANVNEEALANVNEEGAGNKNNRTRWIRAVSKKATDVLQQIDTLDAQLENTELPDTERKRLLKERAKLQKKMGKITKVSRKSFLGKRYKRWLLLLSRKKQKTYLKGTTYTDTTTIAHWLWTLSIEENILERTFIQEAGKEISQINKTPSLKPDEIRTFLATEFVERMKQQNPNADEKRHILSVEHILADIEKIFDPSITMRERYLLTLLVETVLTGFFEHLLRLIYNKLSTEHTSDLGLWKRIGERAKLRGRLGRFIYYAFAYSDFLRTISLINNKAKLHSYKYEAMGNVLTLFEYLNTLSQASKSKNTYQEVLNILDQHILYIESAQAHREKSTIRSWIPFRAPLPWCRNLVMKF